MSEKKKTAPAEAKAATIGTVHPRTAQFVHMGHGRIQTDSGGWDCRTLAADGTPLIRHRYTQKLFSLTWQEIARLADAAGAAKE